MQKSFSDLEYAAKKKLTRRDRFLAEIDVATPWGKLHKVIEPHKRGDLCFTVPHHDTR